MITNDVLLWEMVNTAQQLLNVRHYCTLRDSKGHTEYIPLTFLSVKSPNGWDGRCTAVPLDERLHNTAMLAQGSLMNKGFGGAPTTLIEILSFPVIQRESEREKEREGGRERQTDRQTDGQTDRQADREADI